MTCLGLESAEGVCMKVPKRRVLPVGQQPMQAISILRHHSFACCQEVEVYWLGQDMANRASEFPHGEGWNFCMRLRRCLSFAGAFREFGLRN